MADIIDMKEFVSEGDRLWMEQSRLATIARDNPTQENMDAATEATIAMWRHNGFDVEAMEVSFLC